MGDEKKRSLARRYLILDKIKMLTIGSEGIFPKDERDAILDMSFKKLFGKSGKFKNLRDFRTGFE